MVVASSAGFHTIIEREMTSFLISDAWAQAGSGDGGGLSSFLPLALIIGVSYLFFFRPKRKRAKQRKNMLEEMKIGDEIVTNGGLLGRVSDLDENVVTLKVATGVNFQVQRDAIAQKIPKGVMKEVDGGGKESKADRKYFKESKDFKELEAQKREIEERIKKLSVKEEIDVPIQTEGGPSDQMAEIQSNDATEDATSENSNNTERDCPSCGSPDWDAAVGCSICGHKGDAPFESFDKSE